MGISFCHSCRTMTEGGLDDTKIDILVNQLRGIGMPAGVGAEILHSTFLQEGFILVVECVVAHRFSVPVRENVFRCSGNPGDGFLHGFRQGNRPGLP